VSSASIRLSRSRRSASGLPSILRAPLRGIQRGLRLRDQLLPPGSLLLPRRFFLAALGISTLLLALELRSGLRESSALILGAARRFGSRRRLFGLAPSSSRSGRSGCSAKRPLDPAGRLKSLELTGNEGCGLLVLLPATQDPSMNATRCDCKRPSRSPCAADRLRLATSCGGEQSGRRRSVARSRRPVWFAGP
jgi:hypothetical protein